MCVCEFRPQIDMREILFLLDSMEQCVQVKAFLADPSAFVVEAAPEAAATSGGGGGGGEAKAEKEEEKKEEEEEEEEEVRYTMLATG